MKIVAIVQARMSSTRLPGKVLKDLAGQPMLARVVTRLSRAKGLTNTVVAITTSAADDTIESLCHQRGWPCFRGSEADVLDRYYQAAAAYDADVVVRTTSDCPLIEPTIVGWAIQEFLQRRPKIDYVSNIAPERTFPRGLDAEVVAFEALRQVWERVRDAASREHVTLHIRRHPERFRIHNLRSDVDYSYMRWTVDTPEDLRFVRAVYDRIGHDEFSWMDVLELLKAHPELLRINQAVRQKAT